MGHGPSTSTNSATTRTSPSRNTSFVNSNPDPQFTVGSGSPLQNGSVENEPPQNLQSKSYLSYHRSTASISKIFQKKRWKKKRGSISASFNMNENDIKVELVNVNIATEEELMTLHGVNRALARNIVNHRELIGGFRKIEDLALVSGMGASKLDQIRPEICITTRRKPGLSRASSKAVSIESIPSSTAEFTKIVGPFVSRFMKLININNATIFDLMGVEGINQAMAARIIEYRDRKGPFKCVEDLRRVGISRRHLTAIKIHLTTEDMDSDKSSTISTNSPARPRHITPKNHIRSISVTSGRPDALDQILESNTNSITPTNTDSEQTTNLKTFYNLMSINSKRPDPLSVFNFSYNNYSAYRVATWNVETLTNDKISNPGVMEVITRTILENRFSVIAMQEICDQNVLEKICKELNEPQLLQNREWTGYRGAWKFSLHPSAMHLNKINHYLGVLYDTHRIDDVEIPESKEICPIKNGSLWQFAVFKIKTDASSWVLINVLSKPLESNTHLNGHAGNVNQHEITDAVKLLVQETQGAMILGYFNIQQAKKGLSDLKDLEMVLPSSGSTDDANVETPQPCSLWITSDLKPYLTDEHGIVEKGLSHLAIPDGWKWGGKVSKFGPLWCTMYSSKSDSSEGTQENLSDEEGVAEDKDSDDCVPVR